jgi:hypothetical protein
MICKLAYRFDGKERIVMGVVQKTSNLSIVPDGDRAAYART